MEAVEFKKQVEKLLEELKDKSDSESVDDERLKLHNKMKALESEKLKVQVQNLEFEIIELEKINKINLTKLEGSLKFSKEANQSIMNDYNQLQEKFEKNIKVSNAINNQLKEQMEDYLKRLNALIIQVDDHERQIEEAKAIVKKEFTQKLYDKRDEITKLNEAQR